MQKIKRKEEMEVPNQKTIRTLGEKKISRTQEFWKKNGRKVQKGVPQKNKTSRKQT